MPWTANGLKVLCTPEGSDSLSYDLVIPITYPYKKSPMFKVTITPFLSGMEQRTSLQTNVKNKFSISMRRATASAATGLYNFYVGQLGPMIPFKWYDRWTGYATPATGYETRYVRFNQDMIDINLDDYDQWSCDIELIEVHDSEIIL